MAHAVDDPVRHRLWGEGRLLRRDDHELLVYVTSVGVQASERVSIDIRDSASVLTAPNDIPDTGRASV